ncbi:MAG: 50S ribosomal protein L4 [Gemmatimonadota bacterium]
MLKAPVITAAGERNGERELPEQLFDGTVHQPAMWQVVKAYLANQRQATASTKGRSDVRGGGRKPWRQKGTGRARQGSIRAPQWRGGGNVFGPRPWRNYTQTVPKKVRWLARRSAYNARAEDGNVFVVESFGLEAPSTRAIVAMLNAAEVSGNILILTDGLNGTVHLSARNLPGVQVLPFGQESTYDVLWADTVIIEGAALERAGEVAHA